MTNDHHNDVYALCKAFLSLSTPQELFCFLKDLCTPTELSALAERWQICQALDAGLSYREIHHKLGSSLTTIGRVARFLKDEPYGGYKKALEKRNHSERNEKNEKQIIFDSQDNFCTVLDKDHMDHEGLCGNTKA